MVGWHHQLMDMSSRVILLETTVASTPASHTWTNYLPALHQFLLADRVIIVIPHDLLRGFYASM